MSLYTRVIQGADFEEIVAYEKSKMQESIADDMETQFAVGATHDDAGTDGLGAVVRTHLGIHCRLECGQELGNKVWWDRGEALKGHRDRLQKQPEMRVEKITLDARSEIKGTEPPETEPSG